MLGLGWLSLRQAQEALNGGRLEEAQRLLAQPAVQGHKRGYELGRQLVRALVERAERHRRAGDRQAAWSDLMRAEQPGLADEALVRLREALTVEGMAELHRLLNLGEAVRAADLAGQLRERNVRLAEVEPLEEAARDWVRGRELSDRGEFGQARQGLERARRLLPNQPALEADYRAVQDREQKLPALLGQLHGAAHKERWQDVLETAEKVLVIAPNHAEARKLRGHAWRSLEPVTVVTAPEKRGNGTPETIKGPDQYLLWIDGVGGFLICLGNKVTFGQAVPEARVDVPIFADVSRHHATLARDSEGYFLEAVRSLQVNGKAVDRAILHSGDRVTLGASCQFQFRQPVPVSASAVLELVSGHRLRVAVNAVVLMADTIVLGPGPQAHIVIPDLQRPVVLYRHKDGLGLNCPGEIAINGKPCKARGVLEPGATVSGEEFSLGLELVSGG